MKILYLHVTQNLGGVEKRFFNYYKYIMQQNDNQYTLLVSRTFLYNIKSDIRASEGNKIISYGCRWNKTGKFTRYIDYVLLTLNLLRLSLNNYDIIHYPTSGALLFRYFLHTKRRVMSAVTSSKEGLYNQVKSRIFASSMKRGFYVDCLDENIGQTIKSFFPNNTNQVFVSPCSFVDYKNTDCDYKDKEHAICFVGRLIEYKGADMLLNSLKEIVEKTNFKIYILGNGDYKWRIEEFVKMHKFENRIVVTYTPSPIEYMKKTKIFLSLQKDENYPSQSLIEAMATKNVIIATNVGLTYKIVHDRWGILIEEQKDLVDALVKLENIDMSKMGEEAMNFVKENHNVENFHQYLMQICSTTVI